jgi:hypothetical protein
VNFVSLKCGIVGLPNVGKSTLFNALTKAGIAAENYPFAWTNQLRQCPQGLPGAHWGGLKRSGQKDPVDRSINRSGPS